MGTALAKIKAKLAKRADEYAGEEKVGGSFITTQGGILKYGEEEFPGNEMIVIILDAIHENTYYPDKFDPDVMLPPVCFAYGRSAEEMEPHENVPDPDAKGADESFFELQAPSCAECPLSEWGSADTGRGKACSNRRRLAVIPAGRFTFPEGKKRRETEMEVFDEPDHYKNAEIAFMKLPVTSTKNWSRFVHKLQKEHNLPPFAVRAHVYIEPDKKNQFMVHFDLIEVVEEEDILEILLKRNEEARGLIEQPYSEPTPEELEKPKAKAKTGLSGLRRKKRK